MGYNLPALRKERDWVAEQRALPYSRCQLDMDYWYEDSRLALIKKGKECGTTYCVAGHLASVTPGITWTGLTVETRNEQYAVSEWARDELGLSDDEAMDLFYSSNYDVLDVLDELIAKAEAEERDHPD